MHDVYVVLARARVRCVSSARVSAWVAEGAARGEKRNWAIQSDVDFRPEIDPEKVRQNLQNVSEGRAIMHELVGIQTHLALYYEDMIHDLDGCMSDILRRVGVPRNPFRITSRKFGSSDLHRLVGNPQDIAGIVAEHAGRTAIKA